MGIENATHLFAFNVQHLALSTISIHRQRHTYWMRHGYRLSICTIQCGAGIKIHTDTRWQGKKTCYNLFLWNPQHRHGDIVDYHSICIMCRKTIIIISECTLQLSKWNNHSIKWVMHTASMVLRRSREEKKCKMTIIRNATDVFSFSFN